MEKKERYINAKEETTTERKPTLDQNWFDEADAFVGNEIVRRGRPRSENPKQAVSLRLDREVIDWFKSKGDGWQTRMNEVLKKAAGV